MIGKPEQSKAFVVMNQALDWAYDHAQQPISALGLDSPVELAENYLKSADGNTEKAIESIIKWQASYAGAAGFASNLGGIFTMPVAIPANLASVLVLQLRMILAIAHLRGYSVKDDKVKTMAFISLLGNSAATVLSEFGVNLATKMSTQVISQISSAALIKINQAVGFRLVSKAGETGLINLTKIVPFVGGIVGGAVDATLTYGVGSAAKNVFNSIYSERDYEQRAAHSL